MKTVVISDLHLGSRVCQAEEIIDFLTEISKSNVQCLVLNGDVFDNHDFRRLYKKHWEILSIIRKISDNINVVWVLGNHDGPLDIISCLLGVSIVQEYIVYSSGKKFLIHHGDIHDRFILKYPITTYVADWCYHIAQRINHKFANFLKRSSKLYSRNTYLVKERAIDMAVRRKFDGVVCGHTHHAEIHAENDIVYVNCGCWTELPCTYAVIENGLLTLERRQICVVK